MLKFLFDALGASLCITAIWIIGNKKWYGWAVSLCAAASYFCLGIIVGLPFLIILNCILFCVHTRNLFKWKREARGEKVDLKACDICMEIQGTQRIEIPIAVESDPEVSKDAPFKDASLDLCPEHMKEALEVMLRSEKEATGEPHRLGAAIWKWYRAKTKDKKK